MLVRQGARTGSAMPRGWTALCLLSLLPSGFTNMDISTATKPPTTRITSATPPNAFDQTTISRSSTITSPNPVSQDSNGTTKAFTSEPTIKLTSTSKITLTPETMSSSVQSQTSLAITVATSSTNFPTSEKTLEPSMLPGNVSDLPPNSTNPMTTITKSYTSSPPIPSTIKGEIKCLKIKEVRLTHGICLEQNETSSCEDFKKDKGEDLIQVLCEKEQTEAEAGAGVCSLLLAQSEVRPHCLLLVLANRTEFSSWLQLMKKHQSDLAMLGIHSFSEQDVVSHQSYSRKTLIALVTSGLLLAVLGTTCYCLMNRRSWSPTGERLELEP
ncbi:hematopoietic progenitor cell antigen CD34 isoform X2 [Choloepus didactylus]|uniref:hematopoietic progenitor cell antigen CD34 isoform X2 n=1 Tax=Choloepus didactylus TaxID=27675 RepID=UPI00189E56C6|nr:hematopoietic progenitor cell antigen CD34 isoform X2 [Choloepus didactylus]